MTEENNEIETIARLENEMNVLMNLSAYYTEESRQLEKERKKAYITNKVVSELHEPCTIYESIGKCFIGTSKAHASAAAAKSVKACDELIQSLQSKRAKTDDGIQKVKESYTQACEDLKRDR
ncbi:hypothetical protein XU18_1900 [Perkinsela sp. CCAP 1560/4]|nr:hypothetical protein XU18_1900 [Perkinsela sp. CCAP 1560/4]|eukprot:KNH07368.1 hypothetical protein XU18_1900 [Perkinsela sp. CCAP 1560/4]